MLMTTDSNGPLDGREQQIISHLVQFSVTVTVDYLINCKRKKQLFNRRIQKIYFSSLEKKMGRKTDGVNDQNTGDSCLVWPS